MCSAKVVCILLAKVVQERKKIRWTDLGLVKKEKQLTGRKLCSFFAKPHKQICPPYFSSNTCGTARCLGKNRPIGPTMGKDTVLESFL
jgi:hypothetical protein